MPRDHTLWTIVINILKYQPYFSRHLVISSMAGNLAFSLEPKWADFKEDGDLRESL